MSITYTCKLCGAPRAAAAALCLSALLMATLASAAAAAPGAQQRAAARQLLKDVVEGPGVSSTAHRFAALDDRGKALDTLKVVPVAGRYIGVYHSAGNGQYDVHVATSTDLMHWTHSAVLDSDASHATIRMLPGGSVIVAYEKYAIGDLIDRPLLITQLDPLYNPLNRIRLRFRYYPSVDDLLAGQSAREISVPRHLSAISEGTPHIIATRLRGGKLSRSTIRVGLHYLKSLRKRPDSDRQATGVLKNFKTWVPQSEPQLDRRFLRARLLHSGFRSAPSGSIGDRDEIYLNGVRLLLQEAEYVPRDWSTWRTFIVDPQRRTAVPLEIKTPRGSTSYGAPTVTELISPAGRRAIFVSMFVFTEGAAPGEAGQLIYYRELS
ncbi:MAG: hypothetical protein M3401_00050 [Actinomycetota bacterium]|nr:hypothetical protein [Actinomycetota bacterium]